MPTPVLLLAIGLIIHYFKLKSMELQTGGLDFSNPKLKIKKAFSVKRYRLFELSVITLPESLKLWE